MYFRQRFSKTLFKKKLFAKFQVTNFLFTNVIYFFLFIYLLASVSGSFFEINSNFLLFTTFTSFLLLFYFFFCNYFFFFSNKSISFNILNSLLDLMNYNITYLHIVQLALLNYNLIFYKNLFIFIKSFYIFSFFASSTLVPVPLHVNLLIYMLLASNVKPQPL